MLNSVYFARRGELSDLALRGLAEAEGHIDHVVDVGFLFVEEGDASVLLLAHGRVGRTFLGDLQTEFPTFGKGG